MAGFVFNEGAYQLLVGTIDWAADTIKARPVLTSGVPSIDADVMTGIGTAGNDVTLTSKTGPTKDDATDRVTYDAADVTFISLPAGSEIDRLVLFKFVTNDAASIPIALLPITPTTPNGANLQVVFDAIGMFYTQQ